ncbi:hypothetical protein [Myroides sp. LoEW2-1]|uniref:hypothetical protein n=1 Tax=Myroides sp. LoEW2-1 TaxID=2683192 RepID=UPI0013285AB4|nr:hypothetical protein [Myroides sp. LoEW2-1]MVX36226.1 hypothetical protein [Myroides sp. LoEW2-1]
MNYIKINKQIAVEKGIIKENSFFPTNGTEVIFKKDILTIWEENNKVDFDFENIKPAEALKTIEEWHKI